MPTHYTASDHTTWRAAGLADYGDYSDRTTDINVRPDGFDVTAGEWYYIPDEPLPDGSRVIYGGSWGNYNSPGASHYTYAEVYSPEEGEAYTARVAELDAMDEYAEGVWDDEEGDEDDYGD